MNILPLLGLQAIYYATRVNQNKSRYDDDDYDWDEDDYDWDEDDEYDNWGEEEYALEEY